MWITGGTEQDEKDQCESKLGNDDPGGASRAALEGHNFY